jgi:peptidoglycan-associated lipoprotein
MTWLLERALLSRLLKLAPLATLIIVAGCHDPVAPAQDPTPPPPTSPLPLADDRGAWRSIGDRIFFDFDSSLINPEARAIIERQVAFAKQHPQMTYTIEGHCDERGTREYNLALGERRAEADRTAWVALGIDPGRLQTVSYGKERPAVIGHDAAAWAQNRRAVSVIN